jgi:serine/threonine protein kinase/tetratricopeptide (TPR) repeat protein
VTTGASLPAGTLLARKYRIVAPLGEGAFGQVYQAEQLGLGRMVAVKRVAGSLAQSAEAVARFQREALAISRLRHPNIVAVHDFGQGEDGSLFLVMELVPGQSLRKLMTGKDPLRPVRILDIIEQILSALECAHQAGVIHRDVKPENVMVEDVPGRADLSKLLDFGLGKLQDDENQFVQTQHGAIVGTPLYVAPEQLRGEPIDARFDLYSTGVMLYEMVTRRPPFRAPTVMGLLSKHLNEPPEPPSLHAAELVRPELWDMVILTALAKRPEERFSGAAEFRATLAEIRGELERGRSVAVPSPAEKPEPVVPPHAAPALRDEPLSCPALCVLVVSFRPSGRESAAAQVASLCRRFGATRLSQDASSAQVALRLPDVSALIRPAQVASALRSLPELSAPRIAIAAEPVIAGRDPDLSELRGRATGWLRFLGAGQIGMDARLALASGERGQSVAQAPGFVRLSEAQARTPGGSQLPFLGRQRELSRVEAILGGVPSGQGRVVQVRGVAGSGKSRLVAEARTSLAGTTVRWMELHCEPETACVPFAPLLPLLFHADHARDLRPSERRWIAALGRPSGAPVDPGVLAATFRRLVLAVGKVPTVLCIEQAEHAGPELRHLASELARVLKGVSLGLVWVGRDAVLSGDVDELELGPFDRREAALAAHTLAQTIALSDEDRRALSECRSLLPGTLDGVGCAVAAGLPVSAELGPERLYAKVVGALTPSERFAVGVAALAPPEFPATWLEEVLGVSLEPRKLLASLLDRGLLGWLPSGKIALRGPVLRDVGVGALAQDSARRFHLRIADLFRPEAPREADDWARYLLSLARRAYHLERAGVAARLGPDEEEALATALRALSAVRASATAWIKVAEQTPRGTPAWAPRYAAAIEVVASAIKEGSASQSELDLLRALALEAPVCPEPLLALLKCSQLPQAETQLSAALRAGAEPVLRARLELEYAQVLLSGPSKDLGLTALKTAGDSLAKLPLGTTFVFRERVLGLLRKHGLKTEARRLADRLVEGAPQAGDPALAARSLALRGVVLCEQGEPEAARADFQRALTLAVEDGDGLAEARLRSNLAQLATLSGDPAVARSEWLRALELATDMGWHEGVAHIGLSLERLAT